MPHGGARSGAGRPKGRKNATIREEVREIQRSLPTVIPPKLIVDGDEKDAAAQANDIMQHAGQMMRAYRALIDNTAAPQQSIADNYMRWANVVLRVASMLLPYQRPTYRSIEIRDERGAEDRRRIFDDPRQEFNRLIIGAVAAVRARMDAPDAAGKPEDRQMGMPRGAYVSAPCLISASG